MALEGRADEGLLRSPALGERVSEYAYLVGIALIALTVGGAALVFARGGMGV